MPKVVVMFLRGVVCIFFLGYCFAAVSAPFHLISARDPGQSAPAGGNGDSLGPIISADGRFVLFSSAANNLVMGSNALALPSLTPARVNVFLRDRTNGTTVLVSVNSSGTGGGNGDSVPTGLSSDRRYVCFESVASDLMPDDTNRVSDVFVRDLQSNATMLVSANLSQVSGNGASWASAITPDGRLVVFVSSASNLVSGDTNGIADVFIRDLEAGVTTLVSAGAKAADAYKSTGSISPDVTPDGRYVLFLSTATNLVPGVGTSGEIYLQDLVNGTTTWVSAYARGLLGANCTAYNQAISADGQVVAYEASGTSSTAGLILRFNLATTTTDVVNTNGYVGIGLPEDRRTMDLTPDGHFIAFVANTNGVTGTNTCVYLWDGSSGASTLVSGGLDGSVASNTICLWPTVEPGGRYVAFLSSGTNLVTNSLSGDYHLYVRDTQAGTTTLIDVNTNGVGSSVTASTRPRLSGDARLVAFDSGEADLVPNDSNHDYDVFIRDLAIGTNELVSMRHPALPTASGNGASVLTKFSVSADGRYVAFASDADNLNSSPVNRLRNIFVRDLFLATNILVSIGTNGEAANGVSSEPAISADGRFVAFTSMADNLTAGNTSKQQNVFLKDIQTGVTILVSITTNGTASLITSYSPVVSADGRFVLFRSTALDLAAGVTSGENLFLRDVQSGTTFPLTSNGVLAAAMTPDGRYVAFAGSLSATNLYVWDSLAAARVFTNIATVTSPIAISPDGNRIVFNSLNTLRAVDRSVPTNWVIPGMSISARTIGRFSGDNRFLSYSRQLNTVDQIYLCDFENQTSVVISQAAGSASPNANSDLSDTSPDARFVIYRSFATNLLPSADNNAEPDLYLFDRVAGATTLLTASSVNGGTPDQRSTLPVFSADGRTLFFQSWASDLTGQDLNHSGDIFALTFLYASLTQGSPGGAPTIRWLARPGESYSAQFKNSLSDPDWHDVPGSVTITGNQAQLTDLSANGAQRFYRITGF